MENKNIRMRFPYDATGSNSLLDGNIHSITPSRLCRIGNSNLFVLDYFDNVASAHCTTFLAFINGYLTKVPVDNYGLAFEMLNRLNLPLHSVSLDMLPSFIDCTQIMSPYDVFNGEYMYQTKTPVEEAQTAAAAGPAGPNNPPINPPINPPVIPPKPPVSLRAASAGANPPKPEDSKTFKPTKHLYIPFYESSFGSIFEGNIRQETNMGPVYVFNNCDDKFPNFAIFNLTSGYRLDTNRTFTFETGLTNYVVHYLSALNPELPNLSHQADAISILDTGEKPMDLNTTSSIENFDESAVFGCGCLEIYPIVLYPKSKDGRYDLKPLYVGGVEDKHSGRR